MACGKGSYLINYRIEHGLSVMTLGFNTFFYKTQLLELPVLGFRTAHFHFPLWKMGGLKGI